MTKIKFKTLYNETERFVMAIGEGKRTKKGQKSSVGIQILSSTINEERAKLFPFNVIEQIKKFYNPEEVEIL